MPEYKYTYKFTLKPLKKTAEKYIFISGFLQTIEKTVTKKPKLVTKLNFKKLNKVIGIEDSNRKIGKSGISLMISYF